MRQFLIACVLLVSAFADAAIIVVLGDIEGDGIRFENFIGQSEAFMQTPQGLRVKPGYHFIFMGDTIDRGDSAMKILDTLNDLKKNQPDQVTTIMGNRDINKLALRTEFASEIAEGLSHDKDYAEQVESLKRFLERINAPQAFEFRKAELSRAKIVTEKDVFISMLQDVMPGGRMIEYLSKAKIVHIDRESGGVFVHGAVSEFSMGRVPGDPKFYENADEWLQKLNTWAQSLTTELLDYQKPLPETPKINRKSLIYDRFSLGDGNPDMPAQAVQNYFKQNKIFYLVAGHTPYGDLPVVMVSPDFKIVLVDNSYASHRRSAVTEIKNGQISVRGYQGEFGLVKADVPIQGPSRFGHLQNGYRILGELSNGELLAWRVGLGYKSEYKTLQITAPSCHAVAR